MPNPNAAPPDETIKRYEAYRTADPDNAALLIALSDLYHRAGRFEDALRCLERCLAGHRNHAAARSRLAGVMISMHRFADAEQALRDVLAEAGPDAALLHNLGVTLCHQRRWPEALAVLRQAQQLGLDRGENLAYVTYCLHNLGDLAGAIESCRHWLSRHPSAAAEGYLAILEMDDGNMLAAHQRAAALLARQPENVDAALVEAMWMTEQQEIDSARACFERIVQAQPENPRGWLGVGLANLYLEQNAAAIEALQTAYRHMPGNVGALTTLAWARFVSRDLAAAEQTFREAIALDRNFGEAHGGLAITLVFLKRYHEARRETRIALRLNPKGFGAIYAHGALMAIDGKRPQGEAEIAAALQRAVMSDGRSLIEHVQTYLRRQIARGSLPKGNAPIQ